jgi:hypothetical protein
MIALAQTSASLFADDYDAVTVKRMTEASGVPSLTSAQAIGRALRALGTLRIAMATPYSQDVIELAKLRRYANMTMCGASRTRRWLTAFRLAAFVQRRFRVAGSRCNSLRKRSAQY